MNLWVCRVNLQSQTLEEDCVEVDDGYPEYASEEEAEMFGGAGYATYNDDGFGDVYAESLKSAEDARGLVRAKLELLHKQFGAALEKIDEVA